MRLALALAVAVVGLAACGEDEPKPGSLEASTPVPLPEGSTPKPEYVREVEEICSLRGTGILTDLRSSVRGSIAEGSTQMEAFNEAISGAYPEVEDHTRKVLKIPPPEGDRAELEEFWGYVFEGFEAVDDYFTALDSGDDQAVAEAALKLDQQESALDFAKSYGIGKCSGYTDAQTAELGEDLEG